MCTTSEFGMRPTGTASAPPVSLTTGILLTTTTLLLPGSLLLPLPGDITG
jgi:hypothetical protein